MGGKIILIFIFFNLITVKSQSLDVFYEVDFRSKKSDTLRKKEDVILLIDTKNTTSIQNGYSWMTKRRFPYTIVEKL